MIRSSREDRGSAFLPFFPSFFPTQTRSTPEIQIATDRKINQNKEETDSYLHRPSSHVVHKKPAHHRVVLYSICLLSFYEVRDFIQKYKRKITTQAKATRGVFLEWEGE
mmetsp:Transcript_30806/g.99327  ORF Transcript_30806/g.99327 Transcript_30806/m.99327 type:complete len:109 (-) Transcript_30806:231-557(-)